MIAPATVATLILALPNEHYHVLLENPVAIATDLALALATVLVAIRLILETWRARHDAPAVRQ